jgi:3-oxoacyl-[acyl-carrier protein] reductase
VSPGVIETAMNAHFTREETQGLIDEIPMGRMGLPEEVASAVLYLAENEYVTGVDIPVNGGFSIV